MSTITIYEKPFIDFIVRIFEFDDFEVDHAFIGDNYVTLYGDGDDECAQFDCSEDDDLEIEVRFDGGYPTLVIDILGYHIVRSSGEWSRWKDGVTFNTSEKDIWTKL